MSVRPSIRGWCPGVVRPMRTGDGLLVRVHPQAGRLTASQLRAVAEAARSCGNGTVEVSSRANLQIRGVRDETHPALVRILDAAGLAEAPGGGPYRPCVVSPLAGLEPDQKFDSFALACAINEALGADSRLAALPAKFGIVMDGGGRFPLDEVSADLRIAAGSEDGTVLIGVADGAGLRWLGPVAFEAAVGAVHGVASAFAALLHQTGGRRLRDLAPALLARTALPSAQQGPTRRPAATAAVGAVQYGKSCAVFVGLPFGRCDAADLETLAGWAETLAFGEIRTTPWRAIAVPGLSWQAAQELLARAARAGFVTEPGDPRAAIAACPGSPSCASAEAPTLHDAARLAPLLHHLPSGATVHVSGCAKGCARRAAADLTLVGEGGEYRVVLGGRPGDAGLGTLPLPTILARLAAGDLVAQEPA